MEDLNADAVLMMSNIILLSETWLLNEENISLNGYHFIEASAGRGKGVAAFVKEVPQEVKKHMMPTIQVLQLEYENIIILVVCLGFIL